MFQFAEITLRFFSKLLLYFFFFNLLLFFSFLFHRPYGPELIQYAILRGGFATKQIFWWSTVEGNVISGSAMGGIQHPQIRRWSISIIWAVILHKVTYIYIYISIKLLFFGASCYFLFFGLEIVWKPKSKGNKKGYDISVWITNQIGTLEILISLLTIDFAYVCVCVYKYSSENLPINSFIISNTEILICIGFLQV